MKSIHLRTINWSAQFGSVGGSYYDRVAEVYAPSETKEIDIGNELISKGWRKVETNNGIAVFEKEKHIVRVFRIWG